MRILGPGVLFEEAPSVPRATLTPALERGSPFVSCVLRRVEDHHTLLHCSPRLKKTCVRQVVLDKWFPLMYA